MVRATDGRLRLLGPLAAAVLLLAACGRREPPPYETWFVPEQPPLPAEGSGNAFDGYARAALEVEAGAGEALGWSSFPSERRNRVLAVCSRPLARLAAATARPCAFRFTAVEPPRLPPYHRGWALLGKALVWRIQDAAASGDTAQAAEWTLVATRFGFDLCGGGAMDATLGLTIVDDARRAVLPFLTRMQAAEMDALSRGLREALRRLPPSQRLVANEQKAMLAGVQAVQDAFREDRLDELAEWMGSTVRPAIQHLKELRRKDPERRAAYFRGFAQEAIEEARWIERVSAVPGVGRASVPGPNFARERPWRRFAFALFTTLRPLFGVHGGLGSGGGFLEDGRLRLGLMDATLARTRLLALHLAFTAQVRREGRAPRTLDAAPADLATDPFTGRRFVYRADGPDFVVYSVGADLRDDGGQTDETSREPDLRLEL
ncbi:MAG: hypothetical protein N2109_08580 [Fimbriimonadales bacterium]|nr:hypothetical protein [Fimbriimonadales bacterium]